MKNNIVGSVKGKFWLVVPMVMALMTITLDSVAYEGNGEQVDGGVTVRDREQEWGRILVGLHKLQMKQPQDHEAIGIAINEVNEHFSSLSRGIKCPDPRAYCIDDLAGAIERKIGSKKGDDKIGAMTIVRVVTGILRPSPLGDGTHDGHGNPTNPKE